MLHGAVRWPFAFEANLTRLAVNVRQLNRVLAYKIAGD